MDWLEFEVHFIDNRDTHSGKRTRHQSFYLQKLCIRFIIDTNAMYVNEIKDVLKKDDLHDIWRKMVLGSDHLHQLDEASIGQRLVTDRFHRTKMLS